MCVQEPEGQLRARLLFDVCFAITFQLVYACFGLEVTVFHSVWPLLL